MAGECARPLPLFSPLFSLGGQAPQWLYACPSCSTSAAAAPLRGPSRGRLTDQEPTGFDPEDLTEAVKGRKRHRLRGVGAKAVHRRKGHSRAPREITLAETYLLEQFPKSKMRRQRDVIQVVGAEVEITGLKI